jgi:spore coat polysaccharide biosynthesis protein SpsF
MLVIVQARLSSIRLPGKMLMDLCGRPLLGRVVDRLGRAQHVSRIVVATSDASSDEAIARFCAREGIACHRGPLEDVAERFRQAASQAAAPAFVRISGDSPLIDPALVDRAIGYFRQEECDLVTNVLVRSFPKGQSVEVLRTATFARLCDTLADGDHREHVTKAYYQAPAGFRIVSFTSGVDAGTANLSVDTPEDFARVRALLEGCADRPGGWRELLASARLSG